MIIPGSKQVIDRATGKLVDCDATTCPYAIDGVNHAPFAAFGGWSGAINAAKDQKTKDAAYAFLSYMAQPEQANVDVTIGATGFNPYRTSQFENMRLWIKAGMSEEAAKDYLGAIKASLEQPEHGRSTCASRRTSATSRSCSTPRSTVRWPARPRPTRRSPRSSPAGTRSPRSSARTSSRPPTRPRSA